jgi:putative nucleotidyltransferase with HDIG domain
MEQGIQNSHIPQEVLHVTQTLEKAGFEAFLVGGCVRDLILGKEPKDWDVTTNAVPEEIISLFSKTVYENDYGTVAVINEELDVSPQLKVIEVTPYRSEGDYSDFRHPDKVTFSKDIKDDLTRRDFTINALAYSPSNGRLIDLYDGLRDIKDKVIRTVGEGDARFAEDALRMMRAIRFSCQLTAPKGGQGFALSTEVIASIAKNADLLKHISMERIRDEFTKTIESPNPMAGVGMFAKLGLLKHFIPELEEGIGCDQKGEHIYDVFEHMLHALGHAEEKGWGLDIRLAALFHDIGKPRTRRWDGTKAGGKGKYTFYGHEVVGARMVAKIMERLRFSKDLSEKVVKLVRYHMFFSDTETITLSAVRRTIVNVGREHIWDLMQIRECDRVGMKKKEAPYRLRKYHAMIEEALRAPTSVGMLKINGEVLIKELNIKPGPRMGWILHALLEECLEAPAPQSLGDVGINNIEYLKTRALELDKLEDKELRALGEKGKEKKEETEEEEIKKLRGKHGVK